MEANVPEHEHVLQGIDDRLFLEAILEEKLSGKKCPASFMGISWRIINQKISMSIGSQPEQVFFCYDQLQGNLRRLQRIIEEGEADELLRLYKRIFLEPIVADNDMVLNIQQDVEDHASALNLHVGVEEAEIPEYVLEGVEDHVFLEAILQEKLSRNRNPAQFWEFCGESSIRK
ncbi:hypothetical protein L1887_03113 [Cichorium endivia]|nr:hypothetical protein L1887_03113 [Cichorium endivia]